MILNLLLVETAKIYFLHRCSSLRFFVYIIPCLLLICNGIVFYVLMPCQVLNCLRVNARIEQIRDVGMTQQVVSFEKVNGTR